MATAELKKKVFDWGGGIPLGCHGGVVGSEILRGDGPVFLPGVLEDLEGGATTKFGDRVLECREVFFGVVVGDHGDKDDLEFAEGFVFFAGDVVLAHIFRDLESSETVCIRRSWSWVGWWSRWGLIGRERDVALFGEDKTEESECGIGGGDGHGLVLYAFLECFQGLPGGFLG